MFAAVNIVLGSSSCIFFFTVVDWNMKNFPSVVLLVKASLTRGSRAVASGGSRTEYLGGPKVGVVSFNESGQTFESKKY